MENLDTEPFARTARAAELGARVIVWNEMATVVSPASEVADEYTKRHPVPVEPSDRGTAHAGVVTFEGISYSASLRWP